MKFVLLGVLLVAPWAPPGPNFDGGANSVVTSLARWPRTVLNTG